MLVQVGRRLSERAFKLCELNFMGGGGGGYDIYF